MDVDKILDALGNESRRRIVELLATKPCYITEISYSLRMAPKVVLEHLEKLERAGIVKSFEIGRRRYYCINKSFGIEILVSPHRFKANVFEIRNGEVLNIVKELEELLKTVEDMRDDSISSIYRALTKFNEIQSKFLMIQSVLAAKFNRFAERLLEEINRCIEDDLEKLVMIALTKGFRTTAEIADCFKIPYKDVERVLNVLMSKGFVKKMGDLWVIV